MTTPTPGKHSKSLFTEHFSELKDPRRTSKGHFMYPLREILLLSISSVVCGWNEWKDIVYFGERNLDWLRKFYPYQNGIPSHDVLERFYKRLDCGVFNTCFINWAASLSKHTGGRVVALDGKTIRGAASLFGDSKLHIVSAFCSLNELSLGQLKVEEKTNEITAVPELLDLICVTGCIVTIDAMGCQKEIAKKIIEKQADYILPVKDNQKELKEQIEKIFKIQAVDKEYVSEEADHGRIEKRTCQVIEKLDFLDGKENWQNLLSVIRITSERFIKKTMTTGTETRYYISSLCGKTTAQTIGESIRSHWAIENKLHWTLDVVMKEDGQRNYAGNTAENMNMIRKIALGLIANEKTVKRSKAGKMKKALLEPEYREMILRC